MNGFGIDFRLTLDSGTEFVQAFCFLAGLFTLGGCFVAAVVFIGWLIVGGKVESGGVVVVVVA